MPKLKYFTENHDNRDSFVTVCSVSRWGHSRETRVANSLSSSRKSRAQKSASRENKGEIYCAAALFRKSLRTTSNSLFAYSKITRATCAISWFRRGRWENYFASFDTSSIRLDDSFAKFRFDSVGQSKLHVRKRYPP